MEEAGCQAVHGGDTFHPAFQDVDGRKRQATRHEHPGT